MTDCGEQSRTHVMRRQRAGGERAAWRRASSRAPSPLISLASFHRRPALVFAASSSARSRPPPRCPTWVVARSAAACSARRRTRSPQLRRPPAAGWAAAAPLPLRCRPPAPAWALPHARNRGAASTLLPVPQQRGQAVLQRGQGGGGGARRQAAGGGGARSSQQPAEGGGSDFHLHVWRVRRQAKSRRGQRLHAPVAGGSRRHPAPARCVWPPPQEPTLSC